MPRGGSKKGERRGGRKKGTQNKATQERTQEVAIALGKAELSILPREVMLAAMRQFFEMAMTAHAEVTRLLAIPDDDDAKAEAVGMEGKFEKYLVLAGDMAYKAAPYLHARLQAIHLSTPQDRAPASAIAELLKEINATMREPRGLLINGSGSAVNGRDTEH